MAARRVRVTIDEELLERIDADPEARKRGRSAFVRSAVVHYLNMKRRRCVDMAIRRAYRGKARELGEEVEPLMRAQTPIR